MRWVLPLGIAVVVLLSACGGDNGVPTASPTSTPSAPATETANPTASPSPTPDPNLITRGPDVAFPPDTAMIIESGCWGCDGGPSALVRLYRDPSGAVRQESLLLNLESGLPTQTIDTPSGPHTVYCANQRPGDDP